jgi:hypothetical protein
MVDGAMWYRPKFLLHLEGGVVLALSVLLYSQAHAGWGRFALLLLTPDLSMFGYLLGTRAGAVCYNVIHTYALPLLLMGFALVFGHLGLMPYALIWTAHIGMDRALGYGLKYPTAFKDTHLQRLE